MDDYNHSLNPANLFMQWISRFSATFFGTLFALIVFAFLTRFYFEMTIGRAIGGMRGNQEQKLTK